MRSSPQHGLQNPALSQMTSAATKALPGHGWAHGLGRGGNGESLPYNWSFLG